jgi:mitochondrial import inner membrane translocase subunit TIM23
VTTEILNIFSLAMSVTSFYNENANTNQSSYLAALTRTHGNVAGHGSQSSSLEYLFEDAYANLGPSWGARICYGTGITYLASLALGGAWGLVSPFSTSQLKSLTNSRLKYNAILNSVTAKGPFVANNAAILALMYNLVHGAVIKGRGGKWDVASAVGSAALVGTIFRSAAGWRSALKGGGMFGTAMLLYQMADTAYDQYQRHNY